MLSEEKARRVIQFIECLKHTKGEFHGEPFKLLPWQEKIIRDVFGTVRDDDPSMRQYNTAYIEIPKKNGKSELGAAIALNMLCNDDEWRAEVYSCASDRQQAAIVFDVAEGKVVPAIVVDHIIPHRGNQRLFWDMKNWQPLCKDCHDRKTGSGL